MGLAASWSGLFSVKNPVNLILAAPECLMSSCQMCLRVRTTCHRSAQDWKWDIHSQNQVPKQSQSYPGPECFPSVWVKNPRLNPRLGWTSKFCTSLKERFHSHTPILPQLALCLIAVLAPCSTAAGLLQGACAVPVLLENLQARVSGFLWQHPWGHAQSKLGFPQFQRVRNVHQIWSWNMKKYGGTWGSLESFEIWRMEHPHAHPLYEIWSSTDSCWYNLFYRA